MKVSNSKPTFFFYTAILAIILWGFAGCFTPSASQNEQPGTTDIATGRTTMHFGEYILLATGRTTMHVGNIICTNTTDETVLFTLEPGLLISTTDKQPLVIPYPITVSIPPNSEITYPITNGICVDITKPAPTKGTPLTYLGPDDFGPPTTPLTDFSSIPGFQPREDLTSTELVPKVPGYEFPLSYTVDLEENLPAAAPILVEAAQILDSVYQEMKEEGAIDTPLPDEAEDESVLQQTFWCFSSALTGNDYKKVDLEENLEKEFEENNGMPLDAAPEEVQESFRTGVDQLWDETFIPLGERAQLFNPASNWKGVDQTMWIETGPGGGTYSLPDRSATITFPSGLDQPVSGTFFSRDYEVEGLKSYGFVPDQVVTDVAAPRISIPSDVPATFSRRLWPDSVFWDLPQASPDGNVSIPLTPSEVLRSEGDKPCVIPSEALVPPKAPEGYVYVGKEVVKNFRYKTESSNVPLDRPTGPDDLAIIKSGTIVQSGVCICDWIVVHLYEPENSKTVVCPVPEDMLKQPLLPPEPGLRYVGRTVVVGFATRPGLTTTPLDRQHKPGDQSHIRSRTFMHEGIKCEVIVEFLYEKE
jgi:hypothetical protein